MSYRQLKDIHDFVTDYKENIETKYVPGIKRKREVKALPEVEVVDLINTVIIRLNQALDSYDSKHNEEETRLRIEQEILFKFYSNFSKISTIQLEGITLIGITELQNCMHNSFDMWVRNLSNLLKEKKHGKKI